MTEKQPSSPISKASALSRLQTLCSRQEKCSYDVMEKMRSWGLPEADQELVLKQLIDEGFLNDTRYIRAYIRDKHRYSKWGRNKISFMLRRKRLDDSLVREVFSELEEEFDWNQLIRSELEKKMRSLSARNNWELQAKLLRFAASRGFDMESVQQLLPEILKDTDL